MELWLFSIEPCEGTFSGPGSGQQARASTAPAGTPAKTTRLAATANSNVSEAL